MKPDSIMVLLIKTVADSLTVITCLKVSSYRKYFKNPSMGVERT